MLNKELVKGLYKVLEERVGKNIKYSMNKRFYEDIEDINKIST